jgi:hypothetical protein
MDPYSDLEIPSLFIGNDEMEWEEFENPPSCF